MSKRNGNPRARTGKDALRFAREMTASFAAMGLEKVPDRRSLMGHYELNGGVRLTHPAKQDAHEAGLIAVYVLGVQQAMAAILRTMREEKKNEKCGAP